METLLIILAIGLPVLLGTSWMNLLIPLATPGRTLLILGNGTLAGLLIIPLLMRFIDAMGMTPGFQTSAPLTGLLIIIGTILYLLRYKKRKPILRPHTDHYSLSPLHKTLFIVLITLLVIRVSSLGLELIWRPLFPWDATMHWATKARVWFEYESLVPFVENSLWLKLGGEGVFTDHHPGYPVTTPLLQVWMNSAIGRWDESLMNIPWVLCLIALGMAFYGQARTAGVTPAISIVFTYILLSMPLINTQVSLAGQADLFLGACYAMAIMAFHNWSVKKQTWQAILAIFFAFSCLLIKDEGFYWLLTFVPALMVVLLPKRTAISLFLLLLFILSITLLFIPDDLSIAGHSLAQLNLYFRPGSPTGIASSLFIHDNWHLFAYLLTSLLVLGLIIARPTKHTYLGIMTALGVASALFLVLFLFTRYAQGAIWFTAAGRISVQLIPSLTFLAMLIFNVVVSSPPNRA